MSRIFSRYSSQIHHFLHHLQLALIVASAISLLHAAGALGWLDAAMLRLASAVQGASRPAVVAPASQPKTMPVVLTISQALYEQSFQQTSPLDRTQLAAVLQAIPTDQASRPSMLVLDIDVSPMAGATPCKPEEQTPAADAPPEVKAAAARCEAQKALDSVLAKLVEQKVQVVLPLPFRVRSPDLIAGKAQWMSDMCRLGGTSHQGAAHPVMFALGEALTNMGQVLQYEPERPTLGMVASNPGDERSQAICKALLEASDPKQWADALLSSAYSDAALAGIIKPQRPHPERRPFNPAFAQHVIDASGPLSAIGSLPPAVGGGAYELAGRKLFLGGSYDRADQFDAPLSGGPVPGVVTHALVYASEANGIKPWHGNGPWGADIFIGVLSAYFFSWVWTKYRGFASKAAQQGGLKPYVWSKLSWLAILLVLIVVLLICTAGVVHLLYPHGMWVDPGPVLIGVGAKFILSSMTASAGHEHPHGNEHEHASLFPTLHARLDWGLVLALAVATWLVNHNLYPR